MDEILLTFGRGVIKLLISLFIGAGAGLLTFGITTMGKPNIWRQPDPPGEMFLGIGVGLLTAGVLLLVLFFIPGRRKAPPPVERREKGAFQIQG
jgi:hypothetical protein